MLNYLKRYKPQIGYALYDWASSPIPALHTTFIFAVYYTSTVSPENGSAEWAWMNALAAITIACICPFMGAISDRAASRKTWLAVFSVVGGIATALLWWVEPDISWSWYALIFSFISVVALESCFTFYNALLSSVSTPANIGKVSGFAWASGYFACIFSLLISLVVFIQPETPPFGLDTASAEHIRATMPFATLWFIVFGIPTFLWVKQSHTVEKSTSVLDTLKAGVRTAKSVPGLLKFLVARMCYADALVVLFAFGGIYAARVFGFSQNEVIVFGIAMNVSAGLGSVAVGWFDDRYGSFRVLRFSLVCLIFLAFSIVMVTDKYLFWGGALCLGLFVGPIQSASRTLVASVVPKHQSASIFGLYMISGKATSFVGPFLYGLIFISFKSDRAAMAVGLVFLIFGLLLLGKKSPGPSEPSHQNAS